jgi:hypothetical protein
MRGLKSSVIAAPTEVGGKAGTRTDDVYAGLQSGTNYAELQSRINSV